MTTFTKMEDFSVEESLTFPDGQPHVKLLNINKTIPTVYCRLASTDDVVKLILLRNVLSNQGIAKVNLSILYLMGARMDRALSKDEPFTLQAIADLINSLHFNQVQIFCPHSQKSLDLIMDSSSYRTRESVFFDTAIIKCLTKVPEFEKLLHENDTVANIRESDKFSIVYPDKGACDRMAGTPFELWYKNTGRVILDKNREERTGKILGMKIISGEVKETAIILDDLCDGGATFKGAAECLRQAGAKNVFLAVCHGIFSRGLPIEGIDFVCTTNSFKDWESNENVYIHKVF